jgi:hypothetical protein
MTYSFKPAKLLINGQAKRFIDIHITISKRDALLGKKSLDDASI